MYILEVCNNASILHTILFIKILIKIIFIVAPIFLVLLLTIDLAKNILSKDENENQKNINLAIKRIVYCLSLFFVPLLINAVMSFLDNYNVNFAVCYEKATESNVENLYAEEEARYEQEREKKRQELEENKNQVSQEKQEKEQTSKSALQRAIDKFKKKSTTENQNGTNAYNVSNVTQYTKSNGYISHATSGSRGRTDKKGDQTGKEVTITKNTYHWTYIARFKDPKKAEIAARCVEAGAKNDNIGYGVNDYRSLYNEAKKVNWDLSKIQTKCNTVCSTFVAVCINATGTKITKDLNGYSDSVKTHLKNTGAFNFYSYDKSKTMRGDVLVIARQHVGMAI